MISTAMAYFIWSWGNRRCYKRNVLVLGSRASGMGFPDLEKRRWGCSLTPSTMQRCSQKTPFYEPGSLPSSDPEPWTFQPPELWGINMCCLSHPVHGGFFCFHNPDRLRQTDIKEGWGKISKGCLVKRFWGNKLFKPPSSLLIFILPLSLGACDW